MRNLLDMLRLERFYRVDYIVHPEVLLSVRNTDDVIRTARENTAREIATTIVAGKEFFSSEKSVVTGGICVTCSAVILTPSEYRSAIEEAFMDGRNSRLTP